MVTNVQWSSSVRFCHWSVINSVWALIGCRSMRHMDDVRFLCSLFHWSIFLLIWAVIGCRRAQRGGRPIPVFLLSHWWIVLTYLSCDWLQTCTTWRTPGLRVSPFSLVDCINLSELWLVADMHNVDDARFLCFSFLIGRLFPIWAVIGCRRAQRGGRAFPVLPAGQGPRRSAEPGGAQALNHQVQRQGDRGTTLKGQSQEMDLAFDDMYG